MTVKIGVQGFTRDELSALRCLLYPYKAELSREADSSDLVLCSGFSDSTKPQIRVPKGSGLGRRLPITDYGNGVVDLPAGLIGRCSDKLRTVMNPELSFVYKLITRAPLRYDILPSSIRNRLYFIRFHEIDSNLASHVTNEIARKILFEAFEALGFHLERKSPPSLLITHDIESQKGLGKALSIKRVDDELGLQATWFLCSHQYPIAKDLAGDLANGSIIGSHDTKHDGKLIHMLRRSDIVQRVNESRTKLEELFDTEVKCFRSPLLQFNLEIASALGEAGYQYDFSLPCWEPFSPLTKNGFGIECAQKFQVAKVIEVPLTLFQDHQVLNVMGLNTHEALKLWVKQAELLRSFGGDIVLLVHPDYSFSLHLKEYKALVTSLLNTHMSSAAA